MPTTSSNHSSPTDLRIRLMAAGFAPIPVRGKKPAIEGWQTRLETNPDEIELWNALFSDATSTGLLCERMPTLDIDILNPEAVKAVVDLVRSRFEDELMLVRTGLPPKQAILFRTTKPFSKITATLVAPNGDMTQRLEFLGKGQQVVAYGIHPDTNRPYTWHGGEPGKVELSELPHIDEEQARALVDDLLELIIAEYGYRRGPKSKPKPETNGGTDQQQRERPDTFFGAVNSAALDGIGKWATALLPSAKEQTGTGAWRVTSKALGRDLQEDLSIHPSGIWDFGLEKTYTAVDLVIEHGGAKKPLDAALWLCGQMGIDPASLGWKPPPQPQLEPPPDLNPPEPPVDGPEPGSKIEAGVSLSDFVAYMPKHNYIFRPSREAWPSESVNARIPPVQLFDSSGAPLLNDKGKPVKIAASTWLDKNAPVEQVTWAPGEPELIKDRLISEGGWIQRPDVSIFNLYRPPTIIPGDAAKAGRWRDHVMTVYGEDGQHIIHWLAHRVQKPEQKINHGIVMGGAQGIGKDTMLEPVKRAIGPWNFKEVSPSQIMGRFTGHLKSVILRVSEARDSGDVDRYKIYDHLKSLMAAPPDVLRVDEKNIREHEVLNVCGVVITTNYKTNGIYLPADDRRHFVAWSDLTKEDFAGPPGPDENKYWDDIWAWFDAGGDRDVAAYLAELDLSGFNPKAPPPKTPAFWAIVDANMAPEDAELADAIDKLGTKRLDGTIVLPDIVTLSQIVREVRTESFKNWLEDRKNRRIIPHRMESCGYVPVRNPGTKDGLWAIGGIRQVIYARNTLSVRDAIAAAEGYRW